jgi:hypothetical protein
MSLLSRRAWAALVVVLGLAAPLPAKTIVLTDADCERMAAICADAPRLSWAGYVTATGVYDATYLDLVANRAFLIRFPVDRVPKGQRITKAELMLPVTLLSAGEQKLHVRRLMAEWGAGVCHQYRMTRPNKVEWKQPGARAATTDRAPRDSAVAKVAAVGEQVINLTEDVELWYTGAGANHGWIFTVEDTDVLVRLGSPIGAGKGQWKLRIIYEPE